MRARGFLSGFIVYGLISGIGIVLVFRILETFSSARLAVMDYVFMAVMFGVPMGLCVAYLQRPTTRTFDYDLSEDRRDGLERSLRSIGYHLNAESPSQLTYRLRAIVSVVPDIIVEKETKPLRASGPWYSLRRLEKKLREGKT